MPSAPGVLLGLSVLFAASTARAAIVHVDAAAPPGGDGESWQTAFDDLAVGLAAAGAGDEVWVAAGVYVPDGDRDASFGLPTGVAVYGGFAGDEESRDERDWVLNETILSGDRNGDDGPDFENYAENCYHVLVGSDVDTTLDGFTITGGNAHGPGPAQFGGGLLADRGALVIRNCAFRWNSANSSGGGMEFASGPLTIENCSFVRNEADVGGGLRFGEAALTLRDCVFADNAGRVAGAGAACFESTLVLERCTFRDNFAAPLGIGFGGAVLLDGDATVTDCVFSRNRAGSWGGGLYARSATVANSVFSRNDSETGAGLYLWDGQSAMFNCTVGRSLGEGITVRSGATLHMANSIVWGNTVQMGGPGSFTVTYSDVEGDWPGEGNIDQDPLFVQVGTDNLRLSFGSPCVDAGSNDAVPEGLDVDLDGNPRIQNGTVDMGAYEGENEAQPARAENEDVDAEEIVLLVPNGGGFEPESNTLVIFTNRSGEDDASASLTEYAEDRHPGARGFSALGITAVLETSIDDGGFLAQMFIPFHEDDLDGVDPFTLDLTYYDEGVGNWALAVGRNTARSPGHRGAIGDRVTREGPGPWGVTLQVGDYGVFFNPETRRGFVWANVDHAADFSTGVALCRADTHQPPDSNVDFDDILAVIDNWGAGPGPFDVNGDGVVDADDLFQVLSNWGGCG